MTKSEWRVHLKERLEALMHSKDLSSTQAAWVNCMVKFLRDKSGRWSTFRAHQNEPSMEMVVTRCQHLEWVYPRLIGPKSGAELEWWVPGPRGFITGPYGLSEPDPQGARQVMRDELSGFLVPGLGFDHRGFRLGRGGGFYDRTLAAAPKVPRYGVGFDCQLVPELPTENHDQKLAGFISESGVRIF